MNLTRKNVQLYESIARQSYIDTPANAEYADGTPATDKDFRAIVQMRAALAVFKQMGIVSSDVSLDTREPFVEDFAD